MSADLRCGLRWGKTLEVLGIAQQAVALLPILWFVSIAAVELCAALNVMTTYFFFYEFAFALTGCGVGVILLFYNRIVRYGYLQPGQEEAQGFDSRLRVKLNIAERGSANTNALAWTIIFVQTFLSAASGTLLYSTKFLNGDLSYIGQPLGAATITGVTLFVHTLIYQYLALLGTLVILAVMFVGAVNYPTLNEDDPDSRKALRISEKPVAASVTATATMMRAPALGS